MKADRRLLGTVGRCGALASLWLLGACATLPAPEPAAPQSSAPVPPAAVQAAASRPLEGAARQRLLEGHRVSEPMRFDEAGGHYVGGLSYQLVAAPAGEVLRALEDPDQLARILPYTRHLRELDPRGDRRRLEVTQGNDLVEASYTVEIESDYEKGEHRFWLEPSRPHAIDDVWGYFRVRQFDDERSLITVAVALDVGPGLVRMLFEDRIRDIILATPSRIRDVMEQGPSRVAGRRPSTDARIARQP